MHACILEVDPIQTNLSQWLWCTSSEDEIIRTMSCNFTGKKAGALEHHQIKPDNEKMRCHLYETNNLFVQWTFLDKFAIEKTSQ